MLLQIIILVNVRTAMIQLRTGLMSIFRTLARWIVAHATPRMPQPGITVDNALIAIRQVVGLELCLAILATPIVSPVML